MPGDAHCIAVDVVARDSIAFVIVYLDLDLDLDGTHLDLDLDLDGAHLDLDLDLDSAHLDLDLDGACDSITHNAVMQRTRLPR